MKLNTTKTKVISIILFTLTFLSVFPTHKALAHDAYFLRVLVNESTLLYEGRIEFDAVSSEAKHAEIKLGNFSNMNGANTAGVDSLGTSYAETSDVHNMAFSFPSKEETTGKMFSREKNNATDLDAERAYAINNSLITSLNQILLMINDGQRFKDLESLKTATNAIIVASNANTVTHNGWTINTYPGNDTMVVSKGNQSETFQYRMAKYADNAEYITVGMMAAQGYYSMTAKNITTANISEEKKPGFIEKNLSELVMNVFNGLRSKLGLYSIDELVFNNGPRMAYGYSHGIMKTSWMDTAVAFHLVFQVLAWIALAFSIIKIMFDKTLSTFSVFQQISIVNSVKNIIITGFLLTASFLLLQALLILNDKVVGIFSETSGSFTALGGSAADNGTLASAFLSIYYFIITIYLNFVYIMRGLTTAVLIASAPLFIVSIAFSSKGSKMFSTWSRELIANIFIQSIHAFVLGMLLTIQVGAGGIEMMVISLALIPITKLFKGMIVGESGGLMGEVAGGAMASGAGIAAGALASKGKGKGGAPSGRGAKESEIPGTGTNPERKEHSADIPNASDSNSVLSATPKETNVKNEQGQFAEIKGQSEGSGGLAKITKESAKNAWNNAVSPEGLSSLKDSVKKAAPGAAKSLIKTAGGATLMGAGAAAAIGMGAVAGPQGMKVGQEIMSKGGSLMAGEAKNAWSSGKEIAGNTLNSMKEGNILGVEQLPSGNTAIHRDRAKMSAMGYEDAFSNGKDLGIKYNPKNLSDEDNQNLRKIRDMSIADPSSLAARGIEKVSEGKDGTTTVLYNNYGKNKLGFGDAYTSKNKFVETKRPRDNVMSRYIYNPKDVTPQEAKERN